MLTEKDLQALDQAAALIIGVLERHRIHSEDAAEHRSLFRIIEGDANVLPFPGKQKQPLPDLEEAKILNSDVGIYGATSDDSEQGFVYFTEKEIQTMPKKLKQLITVNRKRCHIRRRPCGSGYTYEIRFRAQGYNLSASGKTKELAKANMLQKMRSASTPEKIHGSTIPTTFNSFAIYYITLFSIFIKSFSL